MTKATPAFALDGPAIRTITPHGPPILMLDRVQAYHLAERRLLAEKFVAQNEPFLQGHFPRYPIFPGVLIIESLAQACRVLMNLCRVVEAGTPAERWLEALRLMRHERSFFSEARVKHISGVYPGDILCLDVQLVRHAEGRYHFRAQALVGGREVGKGQLILQPPEASGVAGGA